jgi:hypothetical protein
MISKGYIINTIKLFLLFTVCPPPTPYCSMFRNSFKRITEQDIHCSGCMENKVRGAAFII